MEERLRVLVIEDEEILRKGLVLTTDWKALGMVVIGEADNGIDGEELARKLKPDIIVTDIAMPGQDGLALIGNLVDDLVSSEFIIISGHAEFTYAQQALHYGVKGYILKPIDPKEFATVLIKSAYEIRTRASSRSGDELLGLKELSDLFLPFGGDYRDRYIQYAVNTIEAHYAESLNIADLAMHMGISERTLSTLFKEKTGYTFLEYLTLFRMHNAARLLQQNESQVQEIAPLVGYKDYRYFTRVFKECFGVTPLQYKRGERP